MIVCIAEKPSVAREIARILGATASRDGYIEGNGYQVTWTFGHLCTLKEPHDYTSQWKAWSLGAFLQSQCVCTLFQLVGKHNGVSLLARHLDLILQLSIDKDIVIARASVGDIHRHAGACELRLHIHSHPVVSHASVTKFLHSAREAHIGVGSLHVLVGSSGCHRRHGKNHSNKQFFSHNINNVD